jgi:hypothetical protein
MSQKKQHTYLERFHCPAGSNQFPPVSTSLDIAYDASGPVTTPTHQPRVVISGKEDPSTPIRPTRQPQRQQQYQQQRHVSGPAPSVSIVSKQDPDHKVRDNAEVRDAYQLNPHIQDHVCVERNTGTHDDRMKNTNDVLHRYGTPSPGSFASYGQ